MTSLPALVFSQNMTDIKANEIGNAAGKRVEAMAGWVKSHAEKMGIKPPKESDF